MRRLAYEASDTGLLSPELAAGIHRVKGAKRLGVRIGNWLTIEQAKSLVQESGRGKQQGFDEESSKEQSGKAFRWLTGAKRLKLRVRIFSKDCDSR